MIEARGGGPRVDSIVTTDLSISVLGSILARRGDTPLDAGGPKQRAVLAILVANVGSTVGAGTILTAIWGEEAPESYRRSLHTYVSNLRALLDVEIIRTGDGYRIEIPPTQIDAVVFEQSLQRARDLIPIDPKGAGECLREALAMWRGRPYADVTYVEGIQNEIRRLDELRLSAVEARVDADLASGNHQQILAEVEALAEEYPVRERFRAQHMLALYRSGRQADALRAYERTRGHLLEELGLEVSQELQDLELAILQHEPWLRQGVGRSTTQHLVFLATEIRDSDLIWDRNPAAMADALTLHDRVLAESIESHGGRPFRRSGAGVVASFPDVIAAVQAAEEAQRRLEPTDWGAAGSLTVGMGLDAGEAESLGGDFLGPPVTRASHLAAAANGGQVLVSATVHTIIAHTPRPGLQVKQLGEHELAGFANAQRIGQLVFEGLPSDFPDLREEEVKAEISLLPALPGYEIREEIGRGALGSVYRAYQPSVGREVAVKIVPPRLASHPRFIHRFEAEARTIAQLAHPRIIPLIDFWRDPRGAHLVLQLIPGGTLQQAIEAGNISRRSAAMILRHIGEALDHAHAQGITHGDLKPSNVLLDGSGNAYVSDFGIAARLLEPDMFTALSADPEFAAPETETSLVTPAGDIYSLGIIARYLITEPAAAAVIGKATAPNPADRYLNAATFISELDLVLGEEPEPPTRPIVTRNPYKGLRAYDEADSPDFFGRTALVNELVRAVTEHPFVAVVGPSGSGKSSVVRAGLLPAVTTGAIPGSGGWLKVTLSPGSSPIDSLIEALEAVAPKPIDIADLLEREGIGGIARRVIETPEGALLLVIDQFEELFTLVNEEGQRRKFLDLLMDTVSADDTHVRVVITLRADFYDRPLEDPKLGPLVRNGLVTVVHPTRDELIEMITGPTNAVGLQWEISLPGRIADDVGRQPGGLPLLQYAMTELVEQRTSDTLSGADYERVGGVTGALSTRAETVFGQLSPRQQEVARDVFLRLISVDEETTGTRRRVRRTELMSMNLDGSAIDAVVDSYISERLLLADRHPASRGPTVEVAHEALIREWPRLGGWIEEQREMLILLRKLRSAMGDWESADRDPGFLLTGSRLAPFLGLDSSTALAGDEGAFLEQSQQRDEAEHSSRRRRRRAFTGALTGITGIALILAGVAFSQAEKATSNAAVASARELTASAINVLDQDPELSVLLALEAATLAEPGFETVSALHEALYHNRLLWTVQWSGDPSFFTGALSPDGTKLALTGIGRIEVWDVEGPGLVWSIDMPADLRVTPFFSSDGEEIVGLVGWPRLSPLWKAPPSDSEPGLYRWNAATGDQVGRAVGDCPIWDIGHFGPNLDLDVPVLVAGFAAHPVGPGCDHGSGTVSLLDLESGAITPVADIDLTDYRSGLSTSNDARYVTFVENRFARVIDTATGEEVARPPTSVWSVTLGPNGRYAVLREDNGVLSVLELESGLSTRLLADTRGESVQFEERSMRVAHYDWSGDIRIFDVDSAKEIGNLVGAPGRAARMEMGALTTSFSSDGTRIASFAGDGSARLWSTAPLGEVGSFPVATGMITAGSVTLREGRGSLLVYPDRPKGGSAVVFDPASGEIAARIDNRTGQTVALSPDGSRLAAQRSDAEEAVGPIEIHDLESGAVMELEGMCTWLIADVLDPQPPCVRSPGTPFQDWARDLEFSPEGSLLALGGGVTGSISIWDSDSGRMLFHSDRLMPPTEGDPHNDGPTIAFDPSGDRLVVSTRDELLIYDTASWRVIERTPMERITRFVFAPNGEHLIGATPNMSILVIDTATWEVRRSLRGHKGHIHDLGVSPDSAVIASSDVSGLVRIWDLETGSPQQKMSLGEKSIQNVEFVDSSHLLVTPQTGPNALILTIDVDELLDIARSRVTRGFTAEECKSYLHHLDTCPAG